ncbi:MAG: hypothetical protein K1X88_28475 [Nannocystaceae bacterium]|nr:hypothetical protein [Nannocystaceae bacterium]
MKTRKTKTILALLLALVAVPSVAHAAGLLDHSCCCDNCDGCDCGCD